MRNENGFGSIVCLDKTGKKRRKPWAVRITTGWEKGRQKRKYLGYYKTQAEALIALAEYHKGGYNLDMSGLTLGEVFDRWIARIESKSSKNVLNSHNMAKARFGNMAKVPMASLKADHLQDWMDGITDLGPGTKRKVKSTMMQLWRYAIKNDIVQQNYAEHIEIAEKAEKTGEIFTDKELKVLWENKDDITAKWILILMYTGMRIGELLVMTADNINLEEQYMIGGLKSEAGRNRIIPIHDKLMPIVRDQLKRSDYLMNDINGKEYYYDKALTDFKDYMAHLKWKHLPHDTRKTAVSLMHGADIPMETIRIIVGHAPKGVTEQVYLRKTPKELVDAINKVEINF